MATSKSELADHQRQELETIRSDIHQFLEQHQNKDLLRFVAVGSVDDGKSTLIGRLLHDLDQVYEDQLEDARKGNKESDTEIDFALLTDGLRAEREQGITIDVAYRFFHTLKRKFIIADTPGHVQYTRNMATGASTADVALILIDARLGVQQQSRRHAYIASLLGIPHLAVCVNKLDLQDYSQEVFEEIQRDFGLFAERLSFRGIGYLPISAKFGDNVVDRSEHTSWYEGPTLLEYLEEVPIESSRNLVDFRLPVQYVLRPHQDYRGFAGQIASGKIREGDEVIVLPSGQTSRVKAIDTFDGKLKEAFAPMSITLCLEDEVDVSRGDMLTQPENLPQVSRSLEAIFVWMNEAPLDPARSYLLKHTTQTVRADVERVVWKSDPNTLENLPTEQLELNDIGLLSLTCHRPLYLDKYVDNRATGALILIDYLTNETVAAGMVHSINEDAGEAAHLATPEEKWQHFQSMMWAEASSDVRLDLSQMQMNERFIEQMEPQLQKALEENKELEEGAIANQDESWQVGHYWLRTPSLAPSTEQQQAIKETNEAISAFVSQVHTGGCKPEKAAQFSQLLLIGIGGSALGPQWLDHALTPANAPLKAHFFDNTDPDGFARVRDQIGSALNETLVLVISKSGGTKETRNGMLFAKQAFEAQGLDFGKHAVAVTGAGSKLEAYAQEHGFLQTFPMWDWVGGRTSLFSAVGLLPAALLGIDTDALLRGAAQMDEWSRRSTWRENPAAWMALSWYHATKGKSERAMALLPYKDRLLLFGRYTQQLVMESLGKAIDRKGREVHQGLTVYGNKGSTDQHALVQQLREGPDDFFGVFIEVLQDSQDQADAALELEPNVKAGDYLLGFLLGTREALRQSGRQTLTLTLPDASASSLGMLVALFERAVGFYASLLDINAYHQPGVEAGKKAASGYVALQQRAFAHLQEHKGEAFTVLSLADALEAKGHTDALFYLLEHLAANGRLARDGDALQARTYTLPA